MNSINCKLLYHSISPHIQQLYTGFKMLENYGLIRLSQRFYKSKTRKLYDSLSLKDAYLPHLIVDVTDLSGNSFIIFFDNHDSKEINTEALSNCAFYFKRSFSGHYILNKFPEHSSRIFPLGLNYLVKPNSIDLRCLIRSFLAPSPSIGKKLNNILSSIDIFNTILFQPRLRYIQSLPLYHLDPKVLFIARTWDPYSRRDRTSHQINALSRINEMRASCIRILKKELGNVFYGGLIPDSYSAKNFKDALIDVRQNTIKTNYLKLLYQFPICIATTGLHNSIGWKFAEYIAFSKAIVTEKLHFEVPGALMPNHNYLEFLSPEECVEKSVKLITDKELRHLLMKNNFDYYQRNLKPDVLVLNALAVAMNQYNLIN